MPQVVLAILVAALTASACGFAQNKGTDLRKGGTTLPANYESWPKINAETILRDEEDDDGTITNSTAIELYAKVSGDLAEGTTLIKVTHSVTDGVVGAVEHIGLMRRVGGEANGGWRFEAYDARSGSRADADVTTCSNCHSLQASNDHLFSPREEVLNATR